MSASEELARLHAEQAVEMARERARAFGRRHRPFAVRSLMDVSLCEADQKALARLVRDAHYTTGIASIRGKSPDGTRAAVVVRRVGTGARIWFPRYSKVVWNSLEAEPQPDILGCEESASWEEVLRWAVDTLWDHPARVGLDYVRWRAGTRELAGALRAVLEKRAACP